MRTPLKWQMTPPPLSMKVSDTGSIRIFTAAEVVGKSRSL